MSQIFHPSANTIARVSIFGAVFFVGGLLVLTAELNRSPWAPGARVAREQPIQFSHERHVAGNGIDCRYCHTSVEDSSFAGIPPTRTCMNCHAQIFANSPFLEPVRESFRTGRSIEWTRVHALPDFVYFNHSIHIHKRIGCTCSRGGEGWWATVQERAHDPVFQERLRNEFASEVEAITDPVARRQFLKLMGASMALAGVTACTRQPLEKIVPYVRQPEELIPGRPLFFATAMPLGGSAIGLLVESHEGRPTKIEGNPLHPSSLGAADVFAQAAILGLYDPDRSQTLTNVGDIRPWSAFLGAIRAALTAQAPLQGAGLRILTESVNSPTPAAQLRALPARYPSARWHQWDPASPEHAREGARLAFGRYVSAQYRISQADVIVGIDADMLGCGPGSLAYAREFAARPAPEH